MIKCLKCNTLYSESATFCLYCRIPLEKTIGYDEKEFTFKVKEFTSEDEAQEFKVNLLSTDVPCVIKKFDDKYVVLINEQLKKEAFRIKPDSKLAFSLEGSKEKQSNKTTFYVTILLGFVIVCFILYFSQIGRTIFFKNAEPEVKIIVEGGTVDENIAERKGTLNKNIPKKVKPTPISNNKKVVPLPATTKEISTPAENDETTVPNELKEIKEIKEITEPAEKSE